ncbi:MAG: hypothetical protein NT174_04840 [Actinobacteria bacterium]|nr:hypothetical protein [Actinomycetota bacterium]
MASALTGARKRLITQHLGLSEAATESATEAATEAAVNPSLLYAKTAPPTSGYDYPITLDESSHYFVRLID